MSNETKTYISELLGPLKNLHKSSPDIMKGFSTLHHQANEPGALDVITKELLAITIGITTHCQDCIALHTKAFIDQGGTREQLIETLNVCIYMGGGPSVMYAAKALKAFDDLTQ